MESLCIRVDESCLVGKLIYQPSVAEIEQVVVVVAQHFDEVLESESVHGLICSSGSSSNSDSRSCNSGLAK